MLRTLGVLALALAGLAIVASGGHIGPVDLTALPPALLGFAAVSVLVLLGLRAI